VHDPDTGEPLWAIENAHLDGVTALRHSHNGRFLVTGGQHGDVRLWEVRSRELISNLKEHTQRVTGLEIFGDDCQAISASRDRCILRWDLRNEVCLEDRVVGWGQLGWDLCFLLFVCAGYVYIGA